MIKRISHVCFGTEDLKRTIEFYQTHFNSRIIHEFINDKGERYGVFLSIGESAKLEFFLSTDMSAQGGTFRHFCLEVDDIELEARAFADRGMPVEIRRGRTDATLQFWITDPNGIRLEFHQYDSLSLLR